MVSGRVEYFQLSDLCSDDDCDGTTLEKCWEAPDMPFYYVQIAPYKYENSSNTGAALLREAQVEALKTIPNSGIVAYYGYW